MISRNEAFELLKKYNKEAFHIQHALTVEAVMEITLQAMAATEDEINSEMEACGI